MAKDIDGSSNQNSVSFSVKGEGFKAIRKEDNTIEVKPIEKNEQEKDFIQLFNFVIVLHLLRGIMFLIGINNWIYHIPTFFWGVIFLIGFISVLKKREALMYHGAEHKVLNCYKKNGEVNIELAIKSSRICMACGTNLLTVIFTFQLISSICMEVWNTHIPEIVTLLLPLFLYKFFPFNILGALLQFITTSEPEERHIEVAICALNETVRATAKNAGKEEANYEERIDEERKSVG